MTTPDMQHLKAMTTAATPRMDAVWDSCGDYEKPHRFAKRVYEAGRALEIQNAELIERIAQLEALPAAPLQQGEDLPELPEPLEIEWPELNSHTLGCGVEDRGLRNRYDGAEYGFEQAVEMCASRVPEQIFDADQMRAHANLAYDIGFGDGLVSIKDSVKAIEGRVLAGLMGATEQSELTDAGIDSLMVQGLPNTRPSAGFRQFARAVESLVRARLARAAAPLPAWIDRLKGSDPTIDDLIAHIEGLPAAPSEGRAIPTWQERFPGDLMGKPSPTQIDKAKDAEIADLRAALANTRAAAPTEWKCFHCGEAFTDPEQARLHFGKTEHSKPACQYDVAELREMEATMKSYADEDTDLHRQMYGMQSKHLLDLRREEEKGYARGLKDANHVEPALFEKLMSAGEKMGNVMFNLAQKSDYVMTAHDCELFDKMRKEWDGARAAAPAAEGASDE